MPPAALSFTLWGGIPFIEINVMKEMLTETSVSGAVIPLSPSVHVRIFYGLPPILYAEGLSNLYRTCIGGESEVVCSWGVFIAAMYWF